MFTWEDLNSVIDSDHISLQVDGFITDVIENDTNAVIEVIKDKYEIKFKVVVDFLNSDNDKSST